jgi:glycosyltransferase involved in cell wall biosynthesis
MEIGKMRIVHVFKDAYPPLVAGITRYMYMAANASVDRNHEVEILVAGAKSTREEEVRPGLKIIRCKEFGRLLSTPLSTSLMIRTRATEADVIHLHMPNPVGELGVLGNETPIVTTFHARLGRQGFLYPIYSPLQRKVFSRSSKILVASPAMAQDIDLKPHVDKIRILPYPVDQELIANIREESTYGGSEILKLLFVGRLVYYKGLDVLLDAIKGLEDISLTIVGEGPLWEAINDRLIKDSELLHKVVMLGRVSDQVLAEQYQTHDVFVAPSISQAEAFGIAMAEGLASGLPAISTSLGTGTDWVNQNGVSGLVIPPGDVKALHDAITELKSLELRKKLSVGARNLAEKRYSAKPHFDELDLVYQEAKL